MTGGSVYEDDTDFADMEVEGPEEVDDEFDDEGWGEEEEWGEEEDLEEFEDDLAKPEF